MTESDRKKLSQEAYSKHNHSESRHFHKWFNELSAEEKKHLFSIGFAPPARNLNNINYLPDGYYITKFSALKDFIKVKNNRVFFFDYDHSEDVELYFNERIILVSFSLDDICKRFRTIE